MRLAGPEFSSWNHWSMLSSATESRRDRGMERWPRDRDLSSSFTWERETRYLKNKNHRKCTNTIYTETTWHIKYTQEDSGQLTMSFGIIVNATRVKLGVLQQQRWILMQTLFFNYSISHEQECGVEYQHRCDLVIANRSSTTIQYNRMIESLTLVLFEDLQTRNYYRVSCISDTIWSNV